MRPTWEELIEDFRQWNRYDDWFVTLEQYDQTNGHNGQVGTLGKYWYEDDHVSKLTDRRIPIHVLTDEYAGDLFRKDSLRRLKSKFHSVQETQSDISSLKTPLSSRGKRSHSPSSNSPSNYSELEKTNSEIVESDPELLSKPDNKWSWNGSGNLRVFLVGSNELSHLAAEINETNSENGETAENDLSRLEVMTSEVTLTLEEEVRLTSKGLPHGCIAVFSNSSTFEFCQNWLKNAVINPEAPFRRLPVSLVFTADEDLPEGEIDHLVKNAKAFMSNLRDSGSQPGSFIAPEGGIYLAMRPIQQTQIKQGLKNFVTELKSLPNDFRVVKPVKEANQFVNLESVITLGVGSNSVDPGPVESFQKYLVSQGAIKTTGSNSLRLENFVFEFFAIPNQIDSLAISAFSSFDGVFLCFSKSNSLHLCAQYLQQVRKEESYRPIQILQGNADQKGHAEYLSSEARKKFIDEISRGYPIISTSDLLNPTVPKSENRFAKKFDSIISGANTVKTARIFDSSLEEVPSFTPDSTLNHNSTFDHNSNIASSVAESLSTADSESIENSIRDRISVFENKSMDPLRSSSTASTPSDGKRVGSTLNHNVGKLDRAKLEGLNGQLSQMWSDRRQSLPHSNPYHSNRSLDQPVQTNLCELIDSVPPKSAKGKFEFFKLTPKAKHEKSKSISIPSNASSDSDQKKSEKPKRRRSRHEKKSNESHPSARHDSDNDSLNDIATSVTKVRNQGALHTSNPHLPEQESSSSKFRYGTPFKGGIGNGIKEKFLGRKDGKGRASRGGLNGGASEPNFASLVANQSDRSFVSTYDSPRRVPDIPPYNSSFLSQNGDFIGGFFHRPLGAEGTFSDLRTESGLVPVFLKTVITEIERIGMEHEGLYRIPADQKKRMELLRHFDRFYNCGKHFSLADLGAAPNTLAGAVQWFLSSKNLPEPVIPTELIPRLQEVMALPESEGEKKLDRLREVFLLLAIREDHLANWQTLKFITCHLFRVSLLAEKNKMHARNIATCLFPTFFVVDPGELLRDGSGLFIEVLCNLIEHHSVIFKDDPDEVKLIRQRELESK